MKNYNYDIVVIGGGAGLTAAVNAISPIAFKKMSYENIIWVTFIDPELAHLALTEAEARKAYISDWENRMKFFKKFIFDK